MITSKNMLTTVVGVLCVAGIAFSIGLSIVTMRLVFIPMLIATRGPTREDAELFSIVSFTIAFVIHSVGAELWIRVTRPQPAISDSVSVSGSGGSPS